MVLSALMSCAGEVSFVYALYGAYLYTLTAGGAEGIVDSGKIIYDLDRAVRAGLLALHASDTAVRAVLTGKRALIVVRALNYDPRLIFDERDD